MLSGYLEYLAFLKDPNEPSLYIYNKINYTLLGLYYVLFCVPHWIFAFKYWIISFKVSPSQLKTTNNHITLKNIIYYTILVLNIFIPVYEAICEGLDNKEFKLSFKLLILIQIVSCVFYFDACRRICWEVKKDKNLKLNYVPMLIHLSSYIFYLAMLFFLYFSFVRHAQYTTQKKFDRD